MNPAVTHHAAAGLTVFVTNEGGAHSAEHWAIVTARMLASPGSNISPARIDACRALRSKMQVALRVAFDSVTVTSSLEQIATTAASVVGRFGEYAADSPWEAEFKHPRIVALMEDVVRRNLATHADIQLRTE